MSNNWDSWRARTYGSKKVADNIEAQYLASLPLAGGTISSLRNVRNKGKKRKNRLKRRAGRGYLAGATVGAGLGYLSDVGEKKTTLDALTRSLIGANAGGVIGAGAGAGYHAKKEASLKKTKRDIMGIISEENRFHSLSPTKSSKKRKRKGIGDYAVNTAAGVGAGYLLGGHPAQMITNDEINDDAKARGKRDSKIYGAVGGLIGAGKTLWNDQKIKKFNDKIDDYYG